MIHLTTLSIIFLMKWVKEVIKCRKCSNESHYAKGMCKRCYNKQWAENHRDAVSESRRRWHDANKDSIRQHYIDNKDKMCEQRRQYRIANAEHIRKYQHQYYLGNRHDILANSRRRWVEKYGNRMVMNKQCPTFLGVHVAERVLSKVFKNVERMPMSNPGYDFVCNRGMKIDVKSSTINKTSSNSSRWAFSIKKNATADYFLLIAFDNRDDLNPMYMWLIPGHVLCDNIAVSITSTTMRRWDEYALDICGVVECCNVAKTS